MRIIFLNQYFPPDPAPTGILFAEIAEACRERGHQVAFVDAAQDYRAAAVPQKGGRMKRELAALSRMLRAGRAQTRADVVISGTSPPCLAVVADQVARRHRARHLHWAMDIYPEIAVALGEIKRRSPVAAVTGWLMGRAYRRCAAVVALDSDMALVLARHRVNPVCIRPWVFRSLLDQLPPQQKKPITAIPPQTRETGSAPTVGAFTCLYSGNLGRAHDYETLLRAQQLLETRGSHIRLKFQGGGPGTPPAQAMARELGLQRCEWAPYVPEEALISSLMENDVLAVTQRPETCGLLWPSKLGLLTALPRPILFIGPTDGAIASELRAYPHAAIFAPGDAAAVAEWLEARARSTAPITEVADPIQHRANAIAHWLTLIGA